MAKTDKSVGVVRRWRSAEEWRGLVRAWKASGELAARFAAARGLSPETLRWWSSELNRRDRAETSRSKVIRFVELTAQPSPTAPGPTPMTRCPGSGIDVVLEGHRVIRIGSGFDVTTLRQVVAVLEERPC